MRPQSGYAEQGHYSHALAQSAPSPGRVRSYVVTFDDVGAKDVTEFLIEHTVEDLVRRLGTDWVRMRDGKRLQDSLPESETLEYVLDG